MFTVYATPILTADNVGVPVQYQPIVPNRNRIMKAVRAWLVFFNNPTFDSLQLDIYSMSGGAIGSLLASSEVRKKSEVISMAHGVKSIYFHFPIKPSLGRGITYALALKINGAYVGDASTHVAWVREPKPFMDHETDPIGIPQMSSAPLSVEIVGDKF